MIRHDKAKVNRLRTYLSWKDLRKNAKDQDASAGVASGTGNPGAGGEDDLKKQVVARKTKKMVET